MAGWWVIGYVPSGEGFGIYGAEFENIIELKLLSLKSYY
jgi:hypothetical protein